MIGCLARAWERLGPFWIKDSLNPKKPLGRSWGAFVGPFGLRVLLIQRGLGGVLGGPGQGQPRGPPRWAKGTQGPAKGTPGGPQPRASLVCMFFVWLVGLLVCATGSGKKRNLHQNLIELHLHVSGHICNAARWEMPHLAAAAAWFRCCASSSQLALPPPRR